MMFRQVGTSNDRRRTGTIGEPAGGDADSSRGGPGQGSMPARTDGGIRRNVDFLAGQVAGLYWNVMTDHGTLAP